MPIAFNTPAHAAHAAGVVPARRDADDDAAATSDAFTLLLLAASSMDDAQAGDEVASIAIAGDAAAATGAATRAEPAAPALPIDPAIEAARATALAAGVVPPSVAAEARTHANPLGRDAADVRTRGDDARVLESARATGRPASAASAAPGAVVSSSSPQVDLAAWRAAHPDDTAAKSGTDTPGAADARAERAMANAAPLREAATDLAVHLPALDAPPETKRATARTGAGDAASALTPLAPTASRVADIRPPLALEVATPAFTPGWQDEAVGRMAHVVMTRNERAELTLHPAELGPVSIRVEMQADQASLTIVAASAETRSALEQSLPQLRDLLAGQGITLGQASVHDGQARRDDSPATFGERAARQDPETTPAPAVASTWSVRPARGRVDVFA